MTLNANEIDFKLTHAVTRYDRAIETRSRKNPRVYYNHYALGHYLGAVERVREDMARLDLSLEEAISGAFCGHLRTVCLKACGITSTP